MQRRIPALVAIGAVMILAAGCSATASPGSPSTPSATPPAGVQTTEFGPVVPGSGEGLRLGYVSAGESVSFNHLLTLSMQRVAEEVGADLVVCDSQADAQKALDCVRSFKTQGVDGYVLYQLAADSAADICAAGPDVPVVGVSIRQDPCERTFVTVSDYTVGYAAGADVGEYFKENFDCDYDAYVSLEYSPVGQSNVDRMGGYAAGFSSACGEIHDKRALDVASTEAARAQFGDVLTTLPGAHRIVAVGIADFVIQGALAAAENAGRTGDVYVSAQGADPSAHCAIATDPQWINDAAYLPERWGEIAVPRLIQLINGEEVPADQYVPFSLVNSDNIREFYPDLAC